MVGFRPGDSYPDAPEVRQASQAAPRSGAAEGNERLTAMTGAVLLVLFAAEGITILSVHQLLTLHFFVGMLLADAVPDYLLPHARRARDACPTLALRLLKASQR